MIALQKSELFQAAVSLLYPATCTICGKNVRAGEYLCDGCEAKIIRIVPPFCETCSEPFEGSINTAFSCANCAHRTIHFDAAVAAYRGRGIVRDVIHEFKYNRQIHLRHLVARWLRAALDDERLRDQPVRRHRAGAVTSGAATGTRFQPSQPACGTTKRAHFNSLQAPAQTHSLHHHANRARSFRAHGKFTQRIPFTKKRGRARLARVVNRRCPHNRLYVERMRARLETRWRKVSSCCHRSTRIIPMAIFKKPAIKAQAGKKREMPRGVFQKCPGCGQVVPDTELAQNQRVCPRCDYHQAQPASERIQSLLDPDTFVEMDADLRSVDVLRFQGMATYTDRLKKYHESTGLLDAVITGHGILDGYKVAIAVMDFGFLAATMGSVVGEKITRTIEYGTAQRCAVIIVAASGGARLYEGMLSLMQMAKTSGALARHGEEKLPYISVLTNPTTAGVMASFASLGDVIIAEPKSMIGFAGPRVIRETTHQDLPERFQTAEFLEEHGLVDMIVHRKKLRDEISRLLSYFAVTP